MRDQLLLGALLSSFATWMTVHAAIAVRLGLAGPRRRDALWALLVPPLAPWWAWRRKWRFSAGLWVTAVAVYALARWLAAVL
ncbi:MAG: hypothetical protein AAGN82_11745 [Myxococcota bacterium]